MYESNRIAGENLVPYYNANKIYPLFFVIFVIIGNFFITNLFVGVLVSTYNREKDKLGNNFLLTEE